MTISGRREADDKLIEIIQNELQRGGSKWPGGLWDNEGPGDCAEKTSKRESSLKWKTMAVD